MRQPGGDVTVAFASIGNAWAQISPLNGRELWAAQQARSSVTHQIMFRGCGSSSGFPLKPKDRIEYQGRYFNITAVLNINERGIEYKVMAEESIEAPRDA